VLFTNESFALNYEYSSFGITLQYGDHVLGTLL